MTPAEAADELEGAYDELRRARQEQSTVEQSFLRRRSELLELALNNGESVAGSERLVEVDAKDLIVDRERKRCALKIAEDRVAFLSLLAALS